MSLKKRKNSQDKKGNKYANISGPQAEFNYHDLGILTTSEIKKLADKFLEKCMKSNFTKVVFITGKGIHSRDGIPVIKPTLEGYLPTLPFVHQVYEGRRDRGGSGTLEVVLSY